MANAALIARAAATVLTDENTRKTMGWIIVAVLSPIILVIAFVCALASGSATHNVSAAELCFYGGELRQDTPEEYRTYIEDMRTSFELLDGFITTANSKTEGEKSLDEIRVKAFFYALYFGEDSPSRRDHQKFVDCFVTYEERTRMVPVEGSDPPTEAEETYTVAIPIEDLETVWRNIAAAIAVTPECTHKGLPWEQAPARPAVRSKQPAAPGKADCPLAGRRQISPGPTSGPVPPPPGPCRP